MNQDKLVRAFRKLAPKLDVTYQKLPRKATVIGGDDVNGYLVLTDVWHGGPEASFYWRRPWLDLAVMWFSDERIDLDAEEGTRQ